MSFRSILNTGFAITAEYVIEKHDVSTTHFSLKL